MTTSITARYPQRVAWATLLVAFMTFCLLVAGIAWAINWVLFDSTIDLRTTVKVSRGTIGYTAPNDTERVVRDRYPVQTGDTVRTDELSQGHLTIADPLNNDQVLATVQLLGGSAFSLEQAARPRFGLGDNPYTVLITDAEGSIDVVVSPQLEREMRLEIRSDTYQVRLDHEGYYRLNFGMDTLEVNVREGVAVVIGDTGEAKLIDDNSTGFFRKGVATRVETKLVDLVQNPLFGAAGSNDNSVDWWGCYDSKPDEDKTSPVGIFERIYFQGRYALHIKRSQTEANKPRSTGCYHSYAIQRTDGDVGLDVSQYDSLYIRATIYLMNHSVNGCGAAGTECPVMIVVSFKNAQNKVEGRLSQWIQGFYVNYNDQIGGRIRCDNCSSNHEHINAESWYTFKSADFVLDIPLDQRDSLRMVELWDVDVYGSGHIYDAYISELALIGVDNDAATAQSVEP
ncbi:MAG: hypothetical protein F9K46_11625 [Anaerolineae bacterium]|nr:MAG: hypothetical protein F9K46_11625 [Anaerolineae bacterium]